MATIRLTPAGTYKVQVRRAGFPAQIQTFRTRKEADAWANRVEDDMKRGNFTPIDRDGQTMTVVKLIERYKKHAQKEGLKIERGALSCFKLIAESNLAEIPINRLTPNAITKFAETRRLTVKPQTVATNLSRLSQVINFANDHLGLQIENPIREIHQTLRTRKIVSQSQERKRRPSADELTRLRAYFKAPAKSRPRRVPMADIIDFAIATTMRAGEFTSIRWSDLHEQRREIMIRARKDPKNKDANDQMVPLTPAALEIIRRQPRIDGEDRIFPHNKHAISTLFPRACQTLKIKDLHFHDLRHEGISRLFELHMSIPDVAKFSGHKDWKSLKRYERMTNASVHHRYERLVEQFGRFHNENAA
jgi:integrase